LTPHPGIAALVLGAAAAALIAWWWLRLGPPVDDEAIRFVAVGFDAIPGWAEDDHAAALGAYLRSCGRAKDADAKRACETAAALEPATDNDAARKFFETHFIPHVVEGTASTGFVTGYYEPVIDGSRKKDARFTVPVLARPDDLVTLKSDIERARFNDEITGARREGEALVPYHTRGEIVDGALAGRGLELLYLEDPVELFFLQVQGSGVVRLPDGTQVRLGFAAKNGHPYTSIGKLLVARGEGTPKDLGMNGLKAWLRADEKRGKALMNENKSYVFFRVLDDEEGKDGPVGAQGVALSQGRSLAVDAAYHRLGVPIFVAAPALADESGKPFRRLMVAQDVGSAIRGPERGDIFWGTGEAAGVIAGGTRADARFFVLMPKD
jgi:membrane-bound lytic murein transglycosylase A